MTTTNIDTVSDAAAALLAEIEKDKRVAKQTREAKRQRVEQARPLLRQVWDELEANRPVKGCTTKAQWCEKFSPTSQRNVEYILAGGNKNRPGTKSIEGVRVGLEDMETDDGIGWLTVGFSVEQQEVQYKSACPAKRICDGDSLMTLKDKHGRRIPWNKVKEGTEITLRHTVRPLEGEMTFEVFQPGLPEKEVVKALVKKTVEFLKATHLPHDTIRKDAMETWKENVEYREQHAKEVSARRSAGVKRAAETRKRDKATKEARDAQLAAFNKKNEEENAERRKQPVKVKLTEAQKREVMAVLADTPELKKNATVKGGNLIFHKTYADDAKRFVAALEQRKAWHGGEYAKLNLTGDLLDWNNDTDEGKAAKKAQHAYNNALKASDAAIKAIIYGDPDSGDSETERNLRAWHEQRENEEYERTWKAEMGDTPSAFLGHQAQIHPAAEAVKQTLDSAEPTPVKTFKVQVTNETITIPLPRFKVKENV